MFFDAFIVVLLSFVFFLLILLGTKGFVFCFKQGI